MIARFLSKLRLSSVLILVIMTVVCLAPDRPSVAAQTRPTTRLARLEPATGTYFGVNLNWGEDSAAAYNQRLGRRAAVYVQFTRFPPKTDDITYLNQFIDQVAAAGGIGLITLEPFDGLSAVTADIADDFATRLAYYNNSRGVPMLVRYAHEMNGSWYPWGEQPTEYVRTFRLLASAIQRRAGQSAMMWAPNYGAGYPFTGGTYEAKSGSADFAILDTNHDGVLNQRDDMYAPYYPGDDVVDWVGMSLYHWGDKYPWGKNNAPESSKFRQQLTGTYNGANGDERDVPDFYDDYVTKRDKPMAIADTSALFNTTVTGDPELLIKQLWWRQVFGSSTLQSFPRIKMINWFEWSKYEVEVQAIVDWTNTRNSTIRSAFLTDIQTGRYLFAEDLHPYQSFLPLVVRR